MADIAIPSLPALTTVPATAVVPVDDAGSTSKATVANIVKGGGAVLKDGTAAFTGNQSMGSHKLTDGAAAAASTDFPILSQVQSLIASALAGAGGGGGDGFVYTLDASTTDGDPTAGKLRLNNATLASVSQVFIDLQDVDGNDTTGWLDRIDDAFGTAKGYIRIGSRSDRTKWVLLKATGLTTTTGYRKIPVTYVAAGAGGGPTTTASDTFFSFEALGFEGTVSAAQGGTGIAGAGGTANRILRTSDGSTWVAAQLALGTDVTGALGFANGGTGLTALGTALQSLRINAGATAFEFYTPAAGLTAPASPADNGKLAIAASGNFTYALLADPHVSTSAAIAGSKIVPSFGAQTVITTNAYRAGTNPSTSGAFNAPNNTSAGAARNAANSGDVSVYYVNGSDKIILGSAAATGIALTAAGAVGFDWDGSAAAVGDQAFVGLEHAYLGGSREVIALCRAAAISSTEMPANSGSGVINVATETVAPTVKPNAGVTVHQSSVLGLMAWNEGGVESVVAVRGGATAKTRKFVDVTKQDNLTTFSTGAQTALSLAPTDVDGAALPSGGVVRVTATFVARRAYNGVYRYTCKVTALATFDSSGFVVVGTPVAETPISTDAGTNPTFTIDSSSGSLRARITPATSDALITFVTMTIDGDSDS